MHIRSILQRLRSPAVLTAALALALSSGVAQAREVRGVEFQEQQTVQGTTLNLVGAGDRTMFGFPAYAAGLYLENPTQDAQQVVTSNQVKRIELHMLRDLSQQQIADAIEQGVRQNVPPDQMPRLEERLNQALSALPSLQRGQVLTVTYVPDRGTTIEGTGMQPVTLPGADFAQAAFSVWLGPNPVQQSLKSELLEGARAPAGGQTSQR